MNNKNIYRILGAVACIFIAIAGIMMYIKTKELNNIAVTVTFFILAIVVLVYKPKSPEERANIKRAKQSERRNSLRGYKLILEHCGGLPLALNSNCTVIYKPDCFEFIGGGHTFTLDIDKITDISIQSSTHRENGSISGAIIGNEILGTPGAIIGGGDRKTTSHYMVITYNNGGIKHINMHFSSMCYSTISSWIKEFKKSRPQETRNIEL